MLAVPWTLLGAPGQPAQAAATLPPGFAVRDMPTGQSELLTDFAWTRWSTAGTEYAPSAVGDAWLNGRWRDRDALMRNPCQEP